MASDKTDALLAELEDALSPVGEAEKTTPDFIWDFQDEPEGDKDAAAAAKRPGTNISTYFAKAEDFSDPFGSIAARKEPEESKESAGRAKDDDATASSSVPLDAASLDAGNNKTFTTTTTTANAIESNSSPEVENFLLSAGKRKSTPRVRFLDDVINDPFAAGFAIEPDDRRHDAWLPSEPTRQLLVSIATKKIAPQSLTAAQLTRPGVLVSDVQLTVSSDLMKHLQPAIPGRQDEDGVRQYILEGRYRAAIDLAGRLLSSCGQGLGKVGQPSKHSPHTLRLWLTRIMLLVKIRQISLAENELAAFGNLDSPDLYFEFYSEAYPGRKGSMVSFAFRLLHAELPSRVGRPEDALDRLYYLQAVTARILSNLLNGYAEDGTEMEMDIDDRQKSVALWRQRESDVRHCIANVFLKLKDYASAIEVYHKLIESTPGNKAVLLSSLGRIYLQMGDLERAASCFDRSAEMEEEKTQARIAFNNGLLHMGQNNFDAAKQQFKECIDQDPGNHLAVNNFAVCSLYLGEMREAIRILESLLNEGYLHEGLIFNLCTLYELQSSRANAKKAAILERLGRHCTDGFDLQSFKLQ